MIIKYKKKNYIASLPNVIVIVLNRNEIIYFDEDTLKKKNNYIYINITNK